MPSSALPVVLALVYALVQLPFTCSLSTSQSPQSSAPPSKNIIFPGGGIFFYWQAGVITHLREQSYPLINNDQLHFTGASAGALCATLTASEVDFESATTLALDKARVAGVWDRPLGLYGIWGDMIDSWLDELLPENDEVLSMVNDKVSLLVTEIPSFQINKISRFQSKQDLIEANMASVHIPLFLNGKLTTKFRNAPHIDGSFMANLSDYHLSEDSVVLNWQADPFLSDRTLGDAVNALSEEGIWDLLEKGRTFAVGMEKRGDFAFLQR